MRLNQFFLIALLFVTSVALGQNFTYTSGSLQVDVFVSNPCMDGATLNRGYISFTVVSTADGLPARLNTIVGNGGAGPNFFTPTLIPIGSTLYFFSNNSVILGSTAFTPNIPAGSYEFIIEDDTGTEFISTFSPTVSHLTLTTLSDIVINQDVLTSNTDCSLPYEGQVVISLTGGSLDLVPGTPPVEQTSPESSFNFTWTSDNGVIPTTFTGTWDGTTQFDLASSLSLTGLPGGIYTVLIEDNYSNCSETRAFTILDPSPDNSFTVGTTTPNICLGTDGVVTLSGSGDGTVAPGVIYEVYNTTTVPAGVPTGITLSETGGPLSFTIPAATILTGAGTYTFRILGDNGDCTPVFMTGSTSIIIDAVATVDAGLAQTVCAGSSTAALGGSFGGAATSATWSTSGDGTFALDTDPNTTYTPGPNDILAGTVTLTLTTDDPSGPCLPASDNTMITINPVATADAGPAQTICEGSTVTLAGTIGGSATSATWSGGTGTFAPDNTTLNAVYTPSAAEVTAGTVTLTLTTNDPDGAGGCAAAVDQVTITINEAATADAGPAQTICEGSTVTLAGTIGGSATSATWSGGTGTFAPDNTTLNAVYTPSAAEVTAGTVTLTLTTNDPDGAGGCAAAVDQVTITINEAATADAGPAQTICEGSTVTLAGTIGGSATSATWSGGTGTFTPDNTTLNAVYTPSAAEVTAGTVTLTLTTNDPDGAGGCAAAVDQVTITINEAATADAGPAQTICEGSTVTLAGTIGGSATSATWSGGTGTFTPDNTTLNAVYTPSAAEVTAGTVTLTLTTNDPDGAGGCAAAVDQVTITINEAATADAGPAQTICEGSTVTLAGTIGGSATSATWSGGTGTFAPDNTTLNAVYTPSAAEVTAGTVTLTLTTNDPDGAGGCAAAVDQVTITINEAATADAGPAQTICEGSTVTLAGTIGGSATSATWSGGTGTFAPDNTTLNAVYTPSAAEVTAGTVTLTLTTNDPDGAGGCPAAVDQVTITINEAATADAGPAQTICEGSTVTLAGTIGGSATSATWSGGTGTFTPDNTTLNAVYTPSAAEVTAGTVTLTLTTNDPDGAGGCAAAVDQVTITINEAATADAGPAQTICEGSTVTLAGTIGGSATSATWSGGTGTFTPDNTTLNAVYTPSAAEVTAGTVTLTLTTNDPDGAGGCPAAVDQVTITINEAATADAGPAQTICEGSTVTLAGTIGGSATSATWSGGTGTFTPDNTTLNAVYTPSAAEVTAGTVTLTLTTNDPDGAGGCPVAVDQVTITISPAATVDAGNPQSVCAGGSVTLAGTRGGSATASIWTTSGDGSFNNVLLLNAAYTPGFNDIANGSVTLTLTTNDPAGPCVAASDNVLITVIGSVNLNLPAAVAVDPICAGGSTSITVDNSEVGVSYQLRNDLDDSNVGSAVVGTGGTISLPTGTLSINTTFNILTTAPGCSAAEQNTLATVTVTGSIDAGLTVTALASPLCEGSSTDIQVFNSENGVTYQLRNDADDSNVGAAIAGTGGTINLPTGALTATTVFNILASNGTCSIELTDIETVSVDVAPDPNLAVGVTIDPLCGGGTSEVTVSLSEVGVSYQLRNDADDSNVGAPVVGTGGTINLSTGALTTTTTFNVLASSGVCSSVELTTLATVTVAGSIDAGLTVTALASPLCAGNSTDIQVFSSENGVMYQLRNDADDSNVGAAVAGTGGTIDLPTGTLTATTVFNVLASNGTCSIELTDIETVSVDVAPDANLTVGVTIDPLCAGGTSEVTISLSEAGVSYQLRNDADDSNIGAAVAGTGGTINLSTGALAATTTFNVLASSGGVCPDVELTTLATVTVAGTIDASLSLNASATPICAGTSSNVQVLNSEAGVNYQLRNDSDDSLIGTPVAGTGGTINLSTGNLTATTIFNVLASNGTCSIELTNKQTITVNPAPNVSLTLNASPGLICSGFSSSIIVTGSEVGVSYQLRNNADNSTVGVAVVGTGGNISLPTGNLASNTTFNVFATVGGCSAQLSNLVTITIRSAGDPVCSGGVNCFAFTVTDVKQRPSCSLQDDGSIIFTVSGGTPNYIVTLTNAAGFNVSLPGAGPNFSFTSLSPADYTYTIQDAGGNVCSLPYSLPIQTNVDADATGFVNAACFGEATGQATLNVLSGGNSPYLYSLDNGTSWTPFTSPATITNLPPNGTYSILVADDATDQCPDEVMVTIGNTNTRIKGVFSVTNATCNGNDGAIDVTSITGGTGGAYSFKLDNGAITTVESFTNLPGGNHIITMIDNSGCARDTIITVSFPGFVNYLPPAMTIIDATCTTKGQISIFIPNPPGSYEIGYTLDPLNEPTNYNSAFYNPATGLVNIPNLNAGTYYVWIRTSSAACATRFENSPGDAEIVIGGPQSISFEVGCRFRDDDGDGLGVLQLNNISASSTDPIYYEIFGNGFRKTGEITPDPMAQDTIHGFATGDYIIWLKQDQAMYGCTVYSDTLSAPSGALDTLLITRNVSFPDQPTGSIKIKIQESGAEPYETWLVESAFLSDTLTAVRNPVTYEATFNSLAAGTYSLFIEDADGCRKQYNVILPFDDTIFIPNVFTPNNDGINEQFYVRNLPPSGSKLSITNRWGKEVYSSNNYNADALWDGGGTPDGVYYYRLQIAGGKTYTGWVEIVRGVKP